MNRRIVIITYDVDTNELEIDSTGVNVFELEGMINRAYEMVFEGVDEDVE